VARRPTRPVFLGQARYRQRRLRDAARLLPVLGVVLWMIPLLWPRGPGGGTLNSDALIYMFAVWIALIVTALLMSRWLVRDEDLAEDAEKDG